jgi:ABC-2 type transport system permease protein
MVDQAIHKEAAGRTTPRRADSGEWVQEVLALTRRWYIETIRERLTLVFSVAQPAIWLMFFGSAVGRAIDREVVGTSNYLGFVLPAIIAFTIIGNGVSGAMPLLWDKETGYLDKLMSMPIARSSVIVSRFLFQMGLGLAQVVGVFLVAVLMGVDVATGVVGVLVVMLAAGLLTLSVAAALAALVYRVPGHGTFFAVSGFVLMPLLFLSNAFVPLDVMPVWMGAIARLNPVTYAIEAMRIPIVSGWRVEALGAFAILGAFAAVCLGFGAHEFRRQTGERVNR